MDNDKILALLEKQRDDLFDELSKTTITQLYKKEYSDIKAGRIFVLDQKDKELLKDLKKLSKDTQFDNAYKSKLESFLELDNEKLIEYFKTELENLFTKITASGKQDELQAIFIEYDFYYHFTSCLMGYGKQDYPLIEEPRYISSEYDFNKEILVIEEAINFEPAWLNCEEFDNLEYLEVSLQLENLYKLHSRTLLHRALRTLNKKISEQFNNKPFTFYINEHDCETMMLYRSD